MRNGHASARAALKLEDKHFSAHFQLGRFLLRSGTLSLPLPPRMAVAYKIAKV